LQFLGDPRGVEQIAVFLLKAAVLGREPEQQDGGKASLHI